MHSVQPAVKMNEYINKNVFSFFFLFFFYEFSAQVGVCICYDFLMWDFYLKTEMHKHIGPHTLSIYSLGS